MTKTSLRFADSASSSEVLDLSSASNAARASARFASSVSISSECDLELFFDLFGRAEQLDDLGLDGGHLFLKGVDLAHGGLVFLLILGVLRLRSARSR